MKTYRKNSIEAFVITLCAEMFAAGVSEIDVRAHELCYDELCGGWITNNVWRMGRITEAEGVANMARGRWEVYKLNYEPRATVKGLCVVGEPEFGYFIESNGQTVLELSPA